MLCSRKCPQAIDVANMKFVKHIDCNLCGDCLTVCPVENTLQVNRKNSLRWLAPIATIILVLAGIFIGTLWEVPTIDQKWFPETEMANAKIFTQSGLKNIKCYGSSMAFAAKMKEVNGIFGVATYVKNHRVKVYYNPEILTEAKIQELLFTPSKTPLKPLKRGAEEVQELTFWVDHFFDLFDFNYLTRLLVQKTNAVGLVSEYDCPVIVKIYFPADEKINEKELIKILESETLTYQSAEKNITVDLGYKVTRGPEHRILSKNNYLGLLFKPFVVQFNSFNKYDTTVVKVFEVPLGDNKENRSKFNYLVSHLSNDKGIIEFRTSLDSNDQSEIIRISFVDSMTNEQAVFNALNSDSLAFTYTNEKTGKMKNIFQFEKDNKMK